MDPDADTAAAAADAPDGGPLPGVARRRAPFSDNPNVGARGQRTQQRILDAALAVLGEVGYHQCSIERITEAAGCARASFYQYFSGKADVFRHLAAQVARQLDAATDWLGPIGPDEDGWAALRGWIGRYAEVYERNEPVFHTFQAAAESDAALAGDFVRTGRRYVVGMQARVTSSDLSEREVEAVVELLQHSLPRTLDDVSMLRDAAPQAYQLPHLLDAFADVAHRTLFGLLPAVNVHEPVTAPPPRLPFGPTMQAALDRTDDDGDPRLGRGGRTRDALLSAGREVFLANGYHGTRIDAIVEAAGVSHGTFYHYFRNKERLAHELATDAMRSISPTLGSISALSSDSTGRAELRRWLVEYNRAQASQSALLRVWVDAALQDDTLMSESAPVLDWGRRQLVRFLGDRGFGDVDADAVVLLALLAGLGSADRPDRTIDAAVLVIERGMLGRQTGVPR